MTRRRHTTLVQLLQRFCLSLLLIPHAAVTALLEATRRKMHVKAPSSSSPRCVYLCVSARHGTDETRTAARVAPTPALRFSLLRQALIVLQRELPVKSSWEVKEATSLVQDDAGLAWGVRQRTPEAPHSPQPCRHHLAHTHDHPPPSPTSVSFLCLPFMSVLSPLAPRGEDQLV